MKRDPQETHHQRRFFTSIFRNRVQESSGPKSLHVHLTCYTRDILVDGTTSCMLPNLEAERPHRTQSVPCICQKVHYVPFLARHLASLMAVSNCPEEPRARAGQSAGCKVSSPTCVTYDSARRTHPEAVPGLPSVEAIQQTLLTAISVLSRPNAPLVGPIYCRSWSRAAYLLPHRCMLP